LRRKDSRGFVIRMPKVIQKPEDKAAQPPGSPVGLSRSTSSGKTDAAEAGQDSHWLPKRSSVAQLLGSHLASAALAKIKEHDDAAAAGNKRESMQGLQGAGLVSKNKSVFDESKMQAAISETEEAVAQEEGPANPQAHRVCSPPCALKMQTSKLSTNQPWGAISGGQYRVC